MGAIMGFISASGTGFAAPTAVSAISALLWLGLTAAQGPAELEIQVQGLRNMRGAVRLCLTRNPAHFPDCNRDPAAVKRSVNAAQAGSIRLAGMAPGVYAL